MPFQDTPLPGEREAAVFLAALSKEYFSFLAPHFSTLCLHDEFIYFPRLTGAWEYWHKVPRLDAASLEAAAARLAEFLRQLDEITPGVKHPELIADAALLRQSLRSVHGDIAPGGPWEGDPFLYLKAASLAWAPVLARVPHLDWQDQEKLAELLAGAARLFTRGRRQVRALSRPTELLCAGAFADARQFFQQVVSPFLEAHFPGAPALKRRLQEVSSSLRRFQEGMAALPSTAPFARGEAGLTEILAHRWGYPRDLEAAAAIIREEIEESRGALKYWAFQVHPGLSWGEALRTLNPPAGPLDLLELYRREVDRLWDFCRHSGVLPPLTGRVVVAETPVYLQTLRSSASYAAPWGPPEDSPGFFYVSPELEDLTHHFQHHRFLSAHETVPGHHLLDTTRLSLTSPLRSQYESPLFYEGWACYAETLLLSEGYLDDPRDHLVGWQRRLWRALRGQVDLELHRGRWELKAGLECLRQAGYPEPTARLQVLHLALNPGYQLCYTLGLKEMLSFRARFAPTLGLARFHELVLSGGQLPFSLLEKRLQAAVAQS